MKILLYVSILFVLIGCKVQVPELPFHQEIKFAKEKRDNHVLEFRASLSQKLAGWLLSFEFEPTSAIAQMNCKIVLINGGRRPLQWNTHTIPYDSRAPKKDPIDAFKSVDVYSGILGNFNREWSEIDVLAESTTPITVRLIFDQPIERIDQIDLIAKFTDGP